MTVDPEALEETLAILSDPELMAALREAEDDIARGDVEVVTAEELAAVMQQRRAAGR